MELRCWRQEEDISIGAIRLSVLASPKLALVLMPPIGSVREVALKFSHFLLS